MIVYDGKISEGRFRIDSASMPSFIESGEFVRRQSRGLFNVIRFFGCNFFNSHVYTIRFCVVYL